MIELQITKGVLFEYTTKLILSWHCEFIITFNVILLNVTRDNSTFWLTAKAFIYLGIYISILWDIDLDLHRQYIPSGRLGGCKGIKLLIEKDYFKSLLIGNMIKSFSTCEFYSSKKLYNS